MFIRLQEVTLLTPKWGLIWIFHIKMSSVSTLIMEFLGEHGIPGREGLDGIPGLPGPQVSGLL